MTVPHGSEGPGPQTTRPGEPGETRYLLAVVASCVLAIAVILGVIPWLAGAWT